MLKKILLTCLLLNTATMGLHIGQANAEDVNTPIVQVEEPNTSVLIEESNDKHYTTEEEVSYNEIESPEVDQAQSSDSFGFQDQNVTGDSEAKQNQTADNNVCQNQTIEGAADCLGETESDVDGQIGQGQTTHLTGSQNQNINTPTSGVKVDQELSAEIVSEQTQVVLFPSGEIDVISQGTDAQTNQKQTVETNNPAKIEVEQKTDITVSQLQDLDTIGEKEDEQEQITEIETSQTQTTQAPGSVTSEQVQTASVDGYFVNTLMEIVDVGVTITTRNYMEVVQDATLSLVNIVQEIFVNGEKIETPRELVMEKGVYGTVQSFEKEYDWGTLIVHNIAKFFGGETTTDSYGTFLSSSISLLFKAQLFGEPIMKPVEEPETPVDEPVTPPVEEENQTPPGTDNGETPIPPTKEEEVSSPPSAPTPVTPSVSEVSVKPIKIEVAPVKTAKVENELPNTATNQYNGLLFGLLLVAGGTAVFLQRKRRV